MQAHTHTHTLRHTLRRTHTLFRIKMKEKQRFQSQMFQSSPTDEISGLSLSLSLSELVHVNITNVRVSLQL